MRAAMKKQVHVQPISVSQVHNLSPLQFIFGEEKKRELTVFVEKNVSSNQNTELLECCAANSCTGTLYIILELS